MVRRKSRTGKVNASSHVSATMQPLQLSDDKGGLLDFAVPRKWGPFSVNDSLQERPSMSDNAFGNIDQSAAETSCPTSLLRFHLHFHRFPHAPFHGIDIIVAER